MSGDDTERRVPAVARHRAVTTLPRQASGLPKVGVIAAFALLMSLAGCATMQRTVGGWFGTATPTPAPTPAPQAPAAAAPRVYYAGTDGLKVYSEASTSSQVLGQLSLHEKVTRFKLERGYAYVESAKSGLKGWVINAQLIWRLPTAPTTAEPSPVETEPEEPAAPQGEAPHAPTPAAQPAATPSPVPAAPPSSPATPGGVAPSIFDAY